MAEKNEIKVGNCSVRFEGDVPVFNKTTVFIKGTVRKMLGDKVQGEKNIGYTIDLDGVSVCECLEPFGASLRIKVATIRDRSDFIEVAERLNGSTIHFSEIDELIGKDGKRQPLLVKWLVSTGKFDEQSARAVYDDPARRAKAQAMFDALMKAASVDDL